MSSHHALIVGAGVGGLSSALSLAGQGFQVTVLEAQAEVGGKMRAVSVGDTRIDGGPTVFTMKWVFDQLFADAGLNFDEAVSLHRADLLARHAWDTEGHFDLHADLERSVQSIGTFFGSKDAANFRQFADEARSIYQTLEGPFLRSSKPSLLGMSAKLGLQGLRTKPFGKLWSSLLKRFEDPRLVQLFGRYSTYTGASPYLAPATLMLIAHVEMDGVWIVEGGMMELAQVLKRACIAKGVTFHTNARVAKIDLEQGHATAVRLQSGERFSGDVVLVNADASAVGTGLLGQEAAKAVDPVGPANRSLSAIGWTLNAKTDGFPLAHHSVFFGRHYKQEFNAIFQQGKYPADPTVYICAQDRTDDGLHNTPIGPERMLMVINAPPNGDQSPDETEMEQCLERSLDRLSACGLTVTVDEAQSVPTGPVGFNKLFPATGGALYGRANHTPLASFQRPDHRTKVPGLYLAGGSVHPGPGVPMAALSGRLAAARIVVDLASTRRSVRMVTVGGMSTA